MSMEYIKPVRCETVVLGGTDTLSDTHGLAARLRVDTGSIYVTGAEDTLSDASYKLSENDELFFGGTLKMKAASGSSATVKILYFEAI